MRGFTLLLLGSASAALAQEARQRMLFAPGTSPGHAGVFLAAAGACDVSETTCETGCMPSGGVCCGDGTNTYCPSGTECRPNGCCPPGKACLGSGGPPTCGAARVRCGSGCMPLLGDCCSDGTYCPAYSKCSANGCASNVLGGGGGGSSGGGSSGGSSGGDGGSIGGSSGSDGGSSSGGSSGSSGSDSGSGGGAIGGNDDAFTSESKPRPTPTTSDDGDSGDAVTVTPKPKPTVTVASDSPSVEFPTTVGGGTFPTNTAVQMSDASSNADKKLAAGLAMAAALLLL